MDNETILLEFWRNHKWPQLPTLYFRLYHDQQGKPLEYSRHDRPGTYVDVTPEQFAIADMTVRVVAGKLVQADKPRMPKLVPCQQGGVACHPDDVTVIVSSNPHRFWNMKTYELT